MIEAQKRASSAERSSNRTLMSLTKKGDKNVLDEPLEG